ncbi:MAG: S9 family peptidase [Alphaproteobacteria bacterium]|nr:MAG: S9 family peptidase [Alphaproteobacteria bacterium]
MRRLLIVAAAAIAATPAFAAPTAPLIERAKLFGNPSRASGRISPDGRFLSWTAPRDGVLNIWVAPVSDPAAARPLTTETLRPIRQYFWAPDSKSILFINDKGGDENFKLFGVDVASGAQRTLTPFDKTRVQIIGVSTTIKDRILVGVNNRDPKWHDVHSLDLATGKLTLVQQNDGYGGFVADDALKLRIASKPRPDGGTEFYKIDGGMIATTAFATIGLDDSQTTAPIGFTADGKTLYWVDSRDRDTAALIAEDFATGKKTIVAEDARADIGDTLVEPRSGRVQAYGVNYLRNEWKIVDPAVQADLDFLQGRLKGEITVTSRTDADDRWTVTVDPVVTPASTWLYDRKAKSLTQLFVGRPELVGAPLVAMYPREIKARDGLTLVSYLSLPPGSDADGDGRPDTPVPMVLFVHGGPWARDDYGYASYHQWLANRGYAVLSVNYRGSTGFGKKFISAGDLQWGRKMHDDLLDATDWAVKQGVTTADKVAIMGGSYGGYATLAGMAFTPTTFACGVDIVGPSNLFTLLQTIPPYWEAGKQQFYKRMGDPTTEAGKALLAERSPLNAADKIVRPLLIGQGANDPRVNVRESDQIVAAMQAKNIPVTYVLFPDEGHGFARPANSIAFNAVAENFLAKCLGGRAEPIGGTIAASSAKVPHGAEYAPGLSTALKP